MQIGCGVAHYFAKGAQQMCWQAGLGPALDVNICRCLLRRAGLPHVVLRQFQGRG